VLRPAGFSKKGDGWYRENDEVLEVFNVQRSQFGGQHYLNYALWLKALGNPAYPKEHQCHIRLRADTIATNLEAVERLLDIERVDADRVDALTQFMRGEFIPFAECCRSLDSLRSLAAAGQFATSFVTGKARAILAAGS
jgi:hypothetical protein